MEQIGRVICSNLPSPAGPSQSTLYQVHPILEYVQRGRLHKLSGKSIPVLIHSYRKEVLHHIQVELFVRQFLSVASSPIAQNHQSEPGSILLTTSLQRLTNIDEVPSQSSLLEVEQAQLPFLVRDILQSLNHLCCPPLL